MKITLRNANEIENLKEPTKTELFPSLGLIKKITLSTETCGKSLGMVKYD